MIRLFRQKRIYLDYASAPPVRREAQVAMHEAERLVGNPGAIHQEAVDAKRSLEESRENIARAFGVKSREIVFTAGLTEANNLGILGFARHLERTKRTLSGTHWIVSGIEHSSVLECFSEIERLGGSVTHAMPDARGLFSADGVQALIRPETVFISIGWANNEIGVVQPLRDIAQRIHKHERDSGQRIMLHSDAGQAPLYLSTTVHSLGVDLLALGSNKLYGPHGIGALVVSNRADLKRVLFGGSQERQLRPGTENVALAAGFARAVESMADEREREARRVKKIRDDFAHELQVALPQIAINGDLSHALPHMLNISVPEVSSEYITLALDVAGIAVSTKSACREGEESASHAVAALGGEKWRAANTLRFSLGRETRAADIPRVVHALQGILSRYER